MFFKRCWVRCPWASSVGLGSQVLEPILESWALSEKVLEKSYFFKLSFSYFYLSSYFFNPSYFFLLLFKLFTYYFFIITFYFLSFLFLLFFLFFLLFLLFSSSSTIPMFPTFPTLSSFLLSYFSNFSNFSYWSGLVQFSPSFVGLGGQATCCQTPDQTKIKIRSNQKSGEAL